MNIIGFFLKETLFSKMFLKKLWIKQYQKAYYNSNVLTLDKYWQLIPEFYSYITIIDIHYKAEYIDLEKGYINYKVIIKIREKYYSFNYTYSPFGADNYDVDQELREVKPTNVVVTKYI